MTALSMLRYDATLGRVLIDMTAVRTALGADGTAYVYRSADFVRFDPVRGGQGVPVTATALPVSDYEFYPDVTTYYAVNPVSGGNYTGSITVDLAGLVWLKSPRFPFLNRTVTVTAGADITRPSRGSTFDVIGRTLPVAVTSARGARNWTLALDAADAAEADGIAALLATGDVLLLQPSATVDLPGGYYSAGDAQEAPTAAFSGRAISIPLAEVAAPDITVTGSTAIYQTIPDTYATYADLLAAGLTYGQIPALVGAPADVIVS